jgi:hypothetical protein
VKGANHEAPGCAFFPAYCYFFCLRHKRSLVLYLFDFILYTLKRAVRGKKQLKDTEM